MKFNFSYKFYQRKCKRPKWPKPLTISVVSGNNSTMTTYVVCDIEVDEPIPGTHSMISLGAVAVNKEAHEHVYSKHKIGNVLIKII